MPSLIRHKKTGRTFLWQSGLSESSGRYTKLENNAWVVFVSDDMKEFEVIND